MANTKKILKSGLWVLLAIVLVMQFFRPEKNTGGASTHDITTKFLVPERVLTIFKTACNDCHSNTTEYPWYANIQPVAWWLNNHVTDGKRHLNFNEFAAYRPYRQFEKLEEIDELVQVDEMPLQSYTLIHGDASLSAEQKEIISSWTKVLRDSLRANYPADSLLKPKRK